ncbi:MAG: DUF559 domain-containing protein [Phycisphaeraceae bacterium]|nr:DUF559 domain-containing protein [Phycisphaeraceae bacterium]
MTTRVRITDVSPRDGLQNEAGVIPTAEKVRLVELLAATGVDEVEVSSFVSAKWVPQLGDAVEVFECLNTPSQREGAGGRVASPTGIGGRHGGSLTPARNVVSQDRAKALRRAMTGPELRLWAAIRDRQLGGYRFRRQHPFGPYILDFYCTSERLVVEVDGRTHFGNDQQVRDAERTEYLGTYGLRVIRVSNDAVLTNIEGVLRTIFEHLRERSPSPKPPPSGRGLPILSALVPNERGMQGVLDVNAKAGRRLISKVSVFTAASETFARKNTNATIAETIDRFRPVVEIARREQIEVRGYISCVIACPLEGPIQPERVNDVARQLLELGIDDLDLGDTIGAGTPETIGALLRCFNNEIGIDSLGAITTLHLHDTFGRAADCVKAALDLGITSFDGSVAGLGGCPYASTPGKRAPGNISTEALVRTVHAAGFTTGVDLVALEAAAAYAREIVARSRAAATKGIGT